MVTRHALVRDELRMNAVNPCAACRDQVTKGRHGRPHAALLAIDRREARGSMFGGWEDTTYRCQTCSALIEHTNDKNEVHIDMGKAPPLIRQEPDRVETKFAKNISTYFFPVGDDFRQIVAEWVEELQTRLLFGPNDQLFPRTKMAHDGDKSFCVAGVEPAHWADASAVRAIYREAFTRAGLPYFPPHSFRHTLGHLMQTMCRTPEQIRAWSQNLGHENIATTLTSYGRIDPHRQGAVIGAISSDGTAGDAELLARIRALVG